MYKFVGDLSDFVFYELYQLYSIFQSPIDKKKIYILVWQVFISELHKYV